MTTELNNSLKQSFSMVWMTRFYFVRASYRIKLVIHLFYSPFTVKTKSLVCCLTNLKDIDEINMKSLCNGDVQFFIA